eukprot:8636906-Pyramimonas_sp.AAC.1
MGLYTPHPCLKLNPTSGHISAHTSAYPSKETPISDVIYTPRVSFKYQNAPQSIRDLTLDGPLDSYTSRTSHAPGTPTRCCLAGTLGGSSASVKCNGSGTRGCIHLIESSQSPVRTCLSPSHHYLHCLDWQQASRAESVGKLPHISKGEVIRDDFLRTSLNSLWQLYSRNSTENALWQDRGTDSVLSEA